MKTRAIIAPQRRVTKKGNIEIIRVWQVPVSKNYPEGINYSFQLISKGKRVLGYDNNTGEGHHKHYLKDGRLVKYKIEFKSWSQVFKKFRKDVKVFEDENQENRTKD